jgi:hypothetical protein|uniref:Uncharacterized protein n=1 Tax=viral metagenome TaxID=1070528 RepID=A0A6C0CEH9_9ZZZZ
MDRHGNGSPNIINNINSFNDNASYYELFNQDIWITIIVFIIVFFIAAYFFIKSTIRSYKAEWEKNKCNPIFMPFASIINPDLANGDDFAYVLDNFKDCLDMLNAESATRMTKPINDIRENLGSFYGNLYGVANTTYEYIVKLFNLMLHFARLFLEKILNFTLNTQLVFITINDFFAKILSVLTVIYYTLQLLIGAYRLIFIVAVMGFLLVFVIPSGLIVTTQIILLVNSIVRLATAAGLLPWSIGFFIVTLVLVIVGIITFIFALIFFIILTLLYVLFLSFVNEIEIR